LAFNRLEYEPYSAVSESRMAAALRDYLRVGGLPEVVLADPELRPRILKEYVDLVFYKDLVERYRVSNPAILRQLLKHCLSHPASLLSAHRLYNDFRCQGFELSKDTLYNYLEYLEESYLIFPLPIADRSVRKQAVNPKKLHVVDWALGYPFAPEDLIDAGAKLETAIFLHWRRRREDLAYLGGDHEIDLVVNAEKPESFINIAFSLSRSDTWEREIAGLERLAQKAGDASRVLVTLEQSERRGPAGVEIVEAWRYLLLLSPRMESIPAPHG
jgi:predicted AAA+ superfamily ATPase